MGVRYVLQGIGTIDQRLQPAGLHQIGNLRQGMSTRRHESPVISMTESSLFGSPRSEELICLFGAQFEAELIDKPHFGRSDRDVCCLCTDSTLRVLHMLATYPPQAFISCIAKLPIPPAPRAISTRWPRVEFEDKPTDSPAYSKLSWQRTEARLPPQSLGSWASTRLRRRLQRCSPLM